MGTNTKNAATNNIAAKYAYHVSWSKEDDCFVAYCAEMPGVAAHGDDAASALKNVLEAAFCAVDVLKEDGQEPPLPLAGYSGKFIVRVPPQLHRALDIEARSQRVSMNKLIAAKLGAEFATKPKAKAKRKRA
jgi:predicted HicB family RNase H-like nuclease